MAIPTNNSKRRPVRPTGASAESGEGERRKAVRKPTNGSEGQQRRRVVRPSLDADGNEQPSPRKRRPVEGEHRRRPTSEQEVRRKRRPASNENSTDFLKEQERLKKEDPALQKQTAKQSDESEIFQPSVDQESIDNPEYAKDPVTGKVYQKIPKTKLDKDGMPMIQTNIDDLDLQSAADQFLAHLRVAPSKEEIAKMRQERIRRAREARSGSNKKESSQEELERKLKASRRK